MNTRKFKIAVYRYLGGAMDGYEVVRATDIGDGDKDLVRISEPHLVEISLLPDMGRNLKFDEIEREIEKVRIEYSESLDKLLKKKEILLIDQN